MSRPDRSRRAHRFFAAGAAALALKIAGGVLVVALLAGAIRILPLLLAPGVPLRLSAPLARGVVAVSLEIALFVAPPVGWALAASRLVERGEARALFAIGVRPGRIVASTWPAAVAVAFAAGVAAFVWGQEAAAPGRLVRSLLADGRIACLAESGSSPAAVDVPLLRLSWVCFPGEPPRAVGPTPFGGGRAVFSATAVTLSDDLRAIDMRDLTLILPSGASEARLQVGEARVRGLAPLGRASNLTVLQRTLLMGSCSVAMATLAALLVLAWSLKSRVAALASGVSGPAAALAVMAQLERAPARSWLYLSVAIAGLGGIVGASVVARIAGRARRS
jgi:hypothetical protein